MTAIKEYIQRRKQQNVVSLFGTIDYDPAYDYKRERCSNAATVYPNEGADVPEFRDVETESEA